MGKSFVIIVFFAALACKPPAKAHDGSAAMVDEFHAARHRMVAEQIERRGIHDRRVLEALRKIPRHDFVAREYQRMAYADEPLPIGEGQTISQPYIVALMSELLQLQGSEKVMEVGTGCGYQAAVLGELAAEVHSIEIIESLCQSARTRLAGQGRANVTVHCQDGHLGLPKHAPFDAILVAAAPRQVPKSLLAQLAEGGRLVIPVGSQVQQLMLFVRRGNQFEERSIVPVRFVPMTGEVQ